jgi:hypothetical protein
LVGCGIFSAVSSDKILFMTVKFALERRWCKCGCGLSFRVLPTSIAKYASIHHDPGYFPRQFDPAIIRQVKALIKRVYGDPPEEIH